MKMPTQRLLTYKTGTTSSVSWTNAGVVNLPKDLSLTNRHNCTHTNGKGVPYVYRCAITAQANVNPGSGSDYAQIFAEDTHMIHCLSVGTVPNTWVARNAGVKMHAARENMFKQQGVRKKERGSYSKTIRYTWDDSGTFKTPQKGVSSYSDYTGGTWDVTALKQDDGDLAAIELMSANGLLSMYLDSRKQIGADSNSDSDSTNQPTDDSIIRALLAPTLGISSRDDNVIALARDEQDNPPYELNNDGDAIEPIEAARLFIGGQMSARDTAVVDAPYGLLKLYAINAYKDDGQNLTTPFEFKIEVLAIYEM